MKKISLACALLYTSMAFATPLSPLLGGNALSVSGAIAAGGDATATGGNTDVDIRQRLQIPTAAPAIAPNVTNTVICPIINQGAEAHTNWFVSNSRSNASTTSINGICVCYHRTDTQERSECMHKYACEVDKVYAKINSCKPSK